MESFAFYAGTSYKFVLTDDSHEGTGQEVQQLYPDADLLTTQRPMGGWAGLYINEATAFRHALERYDFDVLLKLDTDALVIGPEPAREAVELFNRCPKIGMAGQYPNDYFGKPWDRGWPRDRVLNGATTWKYIRRPFSNWYLRKIYRKALANGYEAGESVFGGAYFMSFDCLQKLAKAGFLPMLQLRGLNMGEDHIFSLLVKAVGLELGNLADAGQPFGLSWKGLPVSPERLRTDAKKIVHSTRYFEEMKEEEIRAYFRQFRRSATQTSAKPVVTLHG